MALWTDVYSPAELTGFARAAFEAYEDQSASLAAFLPNAYRDDVAVRFTAGQAGLAEEARYRAYDAEIEIRGGVSGKAVTIDLPPLGIKQNISEYTQLKSRGASAETMQAVVERTVTGVVRGIADRMERQRATVLLTGKATIDQVNYKAEDDFGRAPELTHTEATLWDAGTAGRLQSIEGMIELYLKHSGGVEPGVIVMSRKALRLLKAGDDFKPAAGPAVISNDDLNGILTSYGLPEVVVYNRRTSAGAILPDNQLLMLPEPVSADDEFGTDLGATFWGRTLSSMEADYGIADVDQPGIVAGVYRGEQPPHIAEVFGDAIGLPVLANANLSLAAKIAA